MMMIVALFSLLALLVATAMPAAAAPPQREQTWGDGKIYEFLVTGKRGADGLPSSPAAEPAHRPLYIIAPVDPDNPLAEAGADPGVGAHDHVIPVPPRNEGTFSAIWHVLVVLPGPDAVPGVNVNFRVVDTPFGPAPMLYEADLGDGLQPLTSAEAVEQAVELGLASLFDTEIVFVCPVARVGLAE